MEFAIKNIILYDLFGNVVGFAELKIRRDRTVIKVRHNLGSEQFMFNIVTEGHETRTFKTTGVQSLFEIRGWVNPESEIFVSISKSGEVLASGVVNERVGDSKEVEWVHRDSFPQNDSAEVPVLKSEAVQELDEALRSICIIDENGKGHCETCPYREQFFGGVVGEDEVVG